MIGSLLPWGHTHQQLIASITVLLNPPHDSYGLAWSTCHLELLITFQMTPNTNRKNIQFTSIQHHWTPHLTHMDLFCLVNMSFGAPNHLPNDPNTNLKKFNSQTFNTIELHTCLIWTRLNSMPFGTYDHLPNDPKTKGQKKKKSQTSNTLCNVK